MIELTAEVWCASMVAGMVGAVLASWSVHVDVSALRRRVRNAENTALEALSRCETPAPALAAAVERNGHKPQGSPVNDEGDWFRV